MQLICFNKYIS